MWFRKLTLQEQIEQVKAEARKRKLSCPSAAVGYTAVAVDLGFDEAAEHFLREVIQQKLEALT